MGFFSAPFLRNPRGPMTGSVRGEVSQTRQQPGQAFGREGAIGGTFAQPTEATPAKPLDMNKPGPMAPPKPPPQLGQQFAAPSGEAKLGPGMGAATLPPMNRRFDPRRG
jgi:hypothetical protein